MKAPVLALALLFAVSLLGGCAVVKEQEGSSPEVTVSPSPEVTGTLAPEVGITLSPGAGISPAEGIIPVQETTPPAAGIETGTTPVPSPLPVRSDRAERRIFNFTSGRSEYLVTVDLDPETAPAGGDDCPLASWHPGDEEKLASYYAGIFQDPDSDWLYEDLFTDLRRIRRMEGLNDDEYLELLIHFVQQIPYDPEAPLCPRTPVQVLLDRKGDCDEKSLLLLGLLSREGYDAAILLFPEMHHATAGIRIDTATKPSFRVYSSAGRHFVYIETTRPTFIGLYPDSFADEDPVIIPAGNGTLRYRAINDVMHIVSTQKRMVERMEWLSDTGAEAMQEIEDLETKLSSGTGYSTQEEYDYDYARYTSLVNQYNQYAGDFRAIREVYLYTLAHQVDREGVNGRIANSKVENLL